MREYVDLHLGIRFGELNVENVENDILWPNT